MINFCTLFDSNFAIQGLALYNSLRKHCPSFHLYVFAFDEKVIALLTPLNLQHTTIIPLETFENPALLSVKKERSRGEYCWTATPFTLLYCLEHFNIDACTYVDSDLFFYNNPQVLIDEVPEEKSVLITEHRFSKKYAHNIDFGIYNVQFIYFKNNDDGKKILRWWAERCIEWCYCKLEDGKFGDQKYLDDWADRFHDEVHILEHLGGGLAPWNEQQYILQHIDAKYIGKDKKTNKKFDIIFYHFHTIKIKDENINIDNKYSIYYIPTLHYNMLYRPYHIALNKSKDHMQMFFHSLNLTRFKVQYPNSLINKTHQSIKIFISKSMNVTRKVGIRCMKLFGIYKLYRAIKYRNDSET